MSAARPAPPELLARARRQGKRVVLGVVIVVSVVFIAASASQLVPAVFGWSVTPLPSPTSSPRRSESAWMCATGIRRRLDRSLERVAAQAPGPGPPGSWPDEAEVRGACEKSPEGLDAWASLARLRRAEEELSPPSGDDSGELQALRRDVAAHLPADLR